MAKKFGGLNLSRGINSMIPTDDDEKESVAGASSINDVKISEIEANPDQPRRVFDEEALNELADSIKQIGVVQPITLRKLADGKYQIVAGERRYRASQIAGLESIPAYIREVNESQQMEMALIENIQREDLNAIEEALAYQNLMDKCDYTQDQLSERVGKKRATVANYLRLLRLPAEIQMAVNRHGSCPCANGHRGPCRPTKCIQPNHLRRIVRPQSGGIGEEHQGGKISKSGEERAAKEGPS